MTTTHHCSEQLQEGAYGPAVTDYHEDQVGQFWVTNLNLDIVEYASQVNYCAFCGARAPVEAANKWQRHSDALPIES